MRVFVVAFSGSDNMGDDAIFRSLAGEYALKGFDVACLDFGGGFSSSLKNYAESSVRPFSFFRIAKEISKSDQVVWGGGGLIQQESSKLNLLYFLLVVTLAFLLRKPYEVRGMGVSEVCGKWMRKWLLFLLSKASRVEVRDSESKKILGDLGVEKVVVSPDLAFSLKLGDEVGVGRHERKGVVFFLRPPLESKKSWVPAVFRYRRGRSYRNEELSVQIEMLVALAEKECPNETVYFFSCHGWRDEVFARDAVSGLIKKAGCDFQFLAGDFEDAVELCSNVRAVVSMRFHGCVAAIRAGSPVIGLAYSNKVSSLLMDREGWVYGLGVSDIKAATGKLIDLLRR